MPKPAGDGSGPGGKSAFDISTVRTMQALFGENFRQARIKAGLSQRDIEAQTGMRQAYISQIEGGKQNPTLETLMALAHAVDQDFRTLLWKAPSSPKSQ